MFSSGNISINNIMRRKIIIFLIVISLIFSLILLTQVFFGEKQVIKLYELDVNGMNYEFARTITNKDDVKDIRKILNNINWEITKVDMSRLADYRFIFQYENDAYETKAILYEVWINTDMNQIEMVKGTNKYSLLTKEDSDKLIKLLLQ